MHIDSLCRCCTLTARFVFNSSPSPTGRFGQTTGQFSIPHFLIESCVNMSFLWRFCVSGQLIYSHNDCHCWIVLQGMSLTITVAWRKLSGRSTLQLHYIWKLFIQDLDLRGHKNTSELCEYSQSWGESCDAVFIQLRLCGCFRQSAMLQQTELIFDFASDHINMSQVSEAVMNLCLLQPLTTWQMV